MIRLEGCPVSVAEQVLALVTIGKLKNPFLDPTQSRRRSRAATSAGSRASLLNKLQRKRYQQNGTFAERGQAAPDLGGRVVIGPGSLPRIARAARCSGAPSPTRDGARDRSARRARHRA